MIDRTLRTFDGCFGLLTGVLLICFGPLPAFSHLPFLDRARVAHDSLRREWTGSTGLEHAIETEQLGIWIYDPHYVPAGGWDDRAQALFELSMLAARRFEADDPAVTLRRVNGIPSTGLHWTKALRDLRRDLLAEQYDELAGSYFLQWPVMPAIRRLADGELALLHHRPDSALAAFEEALSLAPHARVAAGARLGIARALYDNRRFEPALDTLARSLDAGGFSADLLHNAALTLIRLGRVREATALFQFAVEINPLHERAHYMLGNGYTPSNYSELAREYPTCFPDSASAVRLDAAKRRLLAGERELASATLQSLALEQPALVEPNTILAELAWLDGAFDTAERLLSDALELCPDHGRAHAILARVQELRRLTRSQRRQAVHDSLAAQPTPELPGSERFAGNWRMLEPELRKRVARSLEPWAAFLPALNAAGMTHTIKPMFMLLSDVPHLQSLRDRRINLDSRLWDDVRGVGGFHAVTGVEDVRRMLYGGYNTLIHELTHQVHGVFTPEQKRRIERLYQRARAREADGERVFMSRYQGSTVWEYFAEGVNAYVTPRIDDYDEREVVRERLDELDPELRALVEDFLAIDDVRENVAVARTNGALELLDEGRADSAWARLAAIDTLWAERAYVLEARAHVASLLDRDSLAVAAARAHVRLHPKHAGGWTSLASALRFSADAYSQPGDTLVEQAAVLSAGLGHVREPGRRRLRLALANELYRAGRFRAAIAHCDSVLAGDPDHAHALWSRAVSRAGLAFGDDRVSREQETGGDSDSAAHAFDETMFALAAEDYKRAIRARSGVSELRLDYARALLRAGKLARADEQIAEAERLDPDGPLPMAYRAWLQVASGDRDSALETMTFALEKDPVPDGAVVIAARLALVDAPPLSLLLHEWSGRPPRHVFNPRRHGYEPRGVIEPWMRALAR
ncbi:MAG: Beta-barrel assembly-enhancing protease [Calditrichaeota bacterium]|nr:Beta-barrel assembly-enhancing protease [Calditrichota bacterium]